MMILLFNSYYSWGNFCPRSFIICNNDLSNKIEGINGTEGTTVEKTLTNNVEKTISITATENGQCFRLICGNASNAAVTYISLQLKINNTLVDMEVLSGTYLLSVLTTPPVKAGAVVSVTARVQFNSGTAGVSLTPLS